MENRPGVLVGDRQTRQKRGALLLRLWRYLGRNRLLLAVAVGLSLGSNILALFGPRLAGQAINAIAAGPGQVDLPFVLNRAATMAVFYLLSACMSYTLSQVMIRLSRQVVRQMRRDVFENLARLPVGFFDRYQTGDILSVITYDVDTVNQSLSADLLQILQTVVTVTVSLGMMLSIGAEAGAHFLCDHPRHHILHPVHHRPGAAPVSAEKRRPGRAQRLYGGNDERPEDHQSLRPGGGGSGGL